jgi:D-serine deaminase-like pyridoxal phosphate-dependent protein
MASPDYFERLGAALRGAGVFRPVLVVDRDRLDGNFKTLLSGRPGRLPLRLVDKSLPSIPLLSYLMERTGTRRIMSFHLPVTLAVLNAFPDADILYGKPLPVGALASQLSQLGANEAERLVASTVFLIDTVDRLDAHARLSAERSVTLRIALEVDTGMHRGGFSSPDRVRYVAQKVAGQGGLKLEGLMAYEAHIPEIPGLFGGAGGEARKVAGRIAAFAAALPPECRGILNTGGSKTVLAVGDAGVANEISVGSAFVKPTDFDTPSLAALEPALFIATPALKVLDARLPGALAVTRLLQALRLFPRKGCFLYGGKWMAKPVHPAGMKESAIWGLSSNQQLMALPDDCRLAPDEFTFFRPTQSEAVMQQFGPLAVYSGGRIEAMWPVLPPG